jgi:hypothetical protein
VPTPQRLFRRIRSARTTTKLLVATLIVLIGAGAGIALAAQPTITAPTITSQPANPTTATSASFSFSDSQSGVTFLCSLDGAAATACTSPKTYPGPLALGTHTFGVQAKDAKGKTSSTTSYNWTVTVTPPVLTGTPAQATTSTSATFSFSDTQVGVTLQCSLDGATYTACVSPKTYPGPLAEATHTFGVRAVNSVGYASTATTYTWKVDLTPPPAPTFSAKPASSTNQQDATFIFADAESGVTYQCQRDGSAFAACASPIAYSGLSAGAHTFAVKAVDAAGNVGPAGSWTWTIDLIAPPTPTISSSPDSSADTTATFVFSDTEAGATLRCRLDGVAFATCTSPKQYTGLAVGAHTFDVQAVDAAGNASASASRSWSVLATVSGFTLSGNITQALSPGTAARLNVKITNPFKFDIMISQLTVTVRRATTKNGQPNPGCDGTVNLIVSSQYTGAPLKVKEERTVSLSDLNVPQSQWPLLTMPDLPTNQDACKGATTTFDYSATATKANS